VSRGRVGPGGSRLWCEGDLVAIALSFQLSRLAIVGGRLRKVLRRVRRLNPHRQRPGTMMLVTDTEVHVVRSARRLHQLLCANRAAVVLDLACLGTDIEAGKKRQRR
jgi:hypothetical protein